MRDIDSRPRWFYRFDNFKRAFVLLKEAIEIKKSRQITQLEKEGTIQRFEYTWELGWKLLKDYLEYKGIILDTITPAATIKAAFEAKIIKSGDLWMQALDERNKMSHTYNLKSFEIVINNIEYHYLQMLEEMCLKIQYEEKFLWQ
jgi:nucleotidyltransferase substrate binding protein (TIGR01987 family)